MGCGLSRRKKPQGPFTRMELDLLELMFEDLAKRSRLNKLEKETFLIFFHLNGLWGQEIFKRFDANNSGDLDFAEFKVGIETLVKGSYNDRIHFLFEFYDIERRSGISYDCLLKMLYSYPKEELKQIIDDERFLGNMKIQERHYYFGKKQELDPLREVVDEESSPDHEMKLRQRKYSEVYKVEEEAQTARKPQGAVNAETRPWAHKPPALQKKKSCSISFGNMNEDCKVKMCSNITLLVKKYASFLFKELQLDRDKDVLNENQFSELIKKHQRIFMFYYESFHNYVWEVDETQIPEFIRNTSWVEGLCSVVEMKNNRTQQRYVRFYKTTIFVFRYKDDAMPLQIVNMEGLYTEEISTAEGPGFIIKHRDGLFPEYAYIFKTKATQEQWLRNLSLFMKNNIYDAYVILEKIGAGNYSIVYKGIQKKTDMPVAIKVIEKFKFSLTEKEVIKQECMILELCHHPSIVTLVDKFQSKTTLYIITEFMGSGDLHDYVKCKKFLEEFEAAIVLSDVVHAVEYLNGLGLIHRDLKSENIMIRLNKDKSLIERAKIIDFGFAVYMDNMKNVSEKERLVGTPNFVCPEILMGEDYDEKADMFSVGVIMFFMLTGELPFDSILADEIVKQTIDCQPYYDETHWRNISEEGKDLISKLLVKKQQRLSVSDTLRHPWIKDRATLKQFQGKNKKTKYM